MKLLKWFGLMVFYSVCACFGFLLLALAFGGIAVGGMYVFGVDEKFASLFPILVIVMGFAGIIAWDQVNE